MTALKNIEIKKIDGTPTTLGEFEGKALLIVNVASKCGLTPQYEQLEALYRDYKAKGLEVLGFPCNQFAGQEPGSEAEIADFCRSTFGVEFPMFSKVDVNGDNRHPLYKALIDAQPDAKEIPDSALKAKLKEMGLMGSGPASDVMWNFEKFLVDKNGKVVGRYAPDMTVEYAVLADAIEDVLA